MRAIVLAMCCFSFRQVAWAQDAPSSPCDAIKQLDAQVAQTREQISELLLRYSELHPFVTNARKNLEKLQTELASQVVSAKSQGIVCPASESQTGRPSPPP